MKKEIIIRFISVPTAKGLCGARRVAMMLLMTMLTSVGAWAADVTVTSSTTEWTDGNTYNVTSNVTINDRIFVRGNVTLYLSAGKTLTASKGIELGSGKKLTINGSGTLDAKGAKITINGIEYRAAAIGSYSFGELIINGGTINANGWQGSAGIGGSYDKKNERGNVKGGSITINGGTINATGANSSAGIGGSSGLRNNNYSSGGFGITLTINGGKVKARRHDGTYAIGPGYYGEKTDYTITVGWTNADDFIDHDGLHTSPSFATGKKFARSGETTNITPYEFRTSGKYVPGATVTFDANGGSSVSTQSVAFGSTASEPTAPTRTGYAFTGWTKGGVAYDFSTAVNEDITLVAQWEKQAVVTFNSNGGTDVATQYVTKGLTASEPTAPTRDGYNFRGWTLGGVAYDFSTAVNDDITLVAQWSAITTLTLGNMTDNEADIATAGATGDIYNVTLSGRTIYVDGDWNTLTLPFSLTAAEIAASPLAELTIKELNGSTSGLDGNGKLTLNFANATEIEAGKPYIARWKSDAEYDLLISNKSDWDAFADAVNGGETFEGKTVMLASDFDNNSDPVEKMVGTYINSTSTYNSFKGTFDGNGRTLTVGINSSTSNNGPFRYAVNATIKNLRVAGSITTSGQTAGGLVARVLEGTVTIQNCISSVAITENYHHPDGTYYGQYGGLIGRINTGTVSISNCLFNGQLLQGSNSNNKGGDGGFVGYVNSGTLSLTSCLFAPSAGITMNSNNSFTFYRKSNSSTVNEERLYYKTTFGTAQGTDASSKSASTLVANGYLGSSNWEVVSNNAVPKMTTTATSHTNIINPTFSNVIIDATTRNVDFAGGTFMGNYAPLEITDANRKSIVLLAAGNKLGYAKTHRTLGAFRAYFDIPSVANAPAISSYELNFGEDDDENTTGIIEVNTNNTNLTNKAEGVFDLQGRRIANGQKPTAKGLYIVNGKKIVIK